MSVTKTHPACTIHEDGMCTSIVGFKTIKNAKISRKMVNPRDIAGNIEEEEEM